MIYPATTGRLDLTETTGRCIVDGCKVKGGGLIRIQNISEDDTEVPSLAWKGKAIALCADHLLEGLTNVFHLPEE